MSMYYGMPLPFDASSHMNGLLTSSLYSSSTTPTHLSQQQQPLALPLSLAPSVGSAVTLQQYQQLFILQQLQHQQQQLEAANARSPAAEDSNVVQQSHHQQHQHQQQQLQHHHHQQQQGSQQTVTSGLLPRPGTSFSPLSSPAHAGTSSSTVSHVSSTLPSSALSRFDLFTNVSEAMNDGEYVAMLAERWRGGGYDGQSLRQLAMDDLAERRKAKRRFPHLLSASAMSPASSALAASALAHSSSTVSSPLRPMHTPLRASGHGSSSSGTHLTLPTPSSFLASHFNFSPLSPTNHSSPTANTPASLLSPGRDGLGPLFSPSRFYASPADRQAKHGKKRMRDSDMTLQPLSLNTDDDEQQHQQHHKQQQQQTEHSMYAQQHSMAHSSTNGRHAEDEDDNSRVALEQPKVDSRKKRSAGSSASSSASSSKAIQQRTGKKQEGAGGNKKGYTRKSKQRKDGQQPHTDNRQQQQHAHGATNGGTSTSATSLISFPLSSLATPLRSGKADPLFSPADSSSRATLDLPSLFSPLQTPQRPAAQHNQFFSETPQHSFTHLFSPGPALFASSASHFPSPAPFVGMTPATPERKHRNRMTAASPIQLLLPSPLSSPAGNEQQQQRHYDSTSDENHHLKHDDQPASASQSGSSMPPPPSSWLA